MVPLHQYILYALLVLLVLINHVEGFSKYASSSLTIRSDAKFIAIPKDSSLRPAARIDTQMFFGFGKSKGASARSSGGSNELPKFYDSWFQKSGDLERAVAASVKAALGQHRCVEVYFDPVPNLDEVKFGTPTNQRFGIEIARDLGLPEYKPGSLAKRYLLEFAQLYWAKRLAGALPGAVFVLSTDNLKKDPITKPGKSRYIYFRSGPKKKKAEGEEELVKPGDTVVIVNPGPTAVWKKALEQFPEQKLVFLNSLVYENYNIGAPLPGVETAYYLKRVSKGYVGRRYPSPWKSYLEGPEGQSEVMSSYDERPQLREVSEELRKTSLERYGIFNDRFAKGFGARL
uniref:DUF1995 domain-containing protein n=1 Tax=Heterosigma akashiwo TaxID=2829 RepID=A0A6V1RIV3_HETAK